MTLEKLNELAESTPESKETTPGEILFFRKNSSIGEALKKLKNHNFKIGCSFIINIGGKEYTKIVAYNQKNDIFSGWAGYINQDDELKEVFPLIGNNFSCYLNMPRIDKCGQLKLYKENMSSLNRQTSYATKMFGDLDNINEVNDISYYGQYWPILENPDVEEYKRLHLNSNRENCSDVAFLCNIYTFDQTYNLLDDGLKRIYRELFEKREELFCKEYKKYYYNTEVIQKTLEYLNMSENDIKEIFDKNNIEYPHVIIKEPEITFSLIKVIKKYFSI